MSALETESIDLVVTSPPYPMIQMWDQIFCQLDPKVLKALEHHKGPEAFELMHAQLGKVWMEVARVLKKGGFACINIGDATRRLGDNFQLYPNHMRIMTHMITLGMSPLPMILWRKQTNAPNKFMGSGTLPAGAYVTLEHEYILIFRKGGKREFKSEEQKKRRRSSALFWEERNVWFSDVWMDLKGARQDLPFDTDGRSRSAAFPLELASRLIHMYSVKEDWILDPFLGLGTTMIASGISARNCVGFEIDSNFRDPLQARMIQVADVGNKHIESRLKRHMEFVSDRRKAKGPLKYTNRHYQFPVVSRQETELFFNEILSVEEDGAQDFQVTYADSAQALSMEKLVHHDISIKKPLNSKGRSPQFRQLSLLD
jgi:DNA modification methylase